MFSSLVLVQGSTGSIDRPAPTLAAAPYSDAAENGEVAKCPPPGGSDRPAPGWTPVGAIECGMKIGAVGGVPLLPNDVGRPAAYG